MTPLDRCPYERCGRTMIDLRGDGIRRCPFHGAVRVGPNGIERERPGRVYRLPEPVVDVTIFSSEPREVAGGSWLLPPVPIGEMGFAEVRECNALPEWGWRDSIRLWWRRVRENFALWLAPWLKKVGTYDFVGEYRPPSPPDRYSLTSDPEGSPPIVPTDPDDRAFHHTGHLDDDPPRPDG